MAISKERAWQEVKDLSYERVTGTEDEKRAAEYLKAECAKLGVEAHFETYEIEKSTIEKVELTVGGKSYNVIGIGKTASTPDEGIDAPVVYLRDGRDADLFGVEGKICLISGRIMGNVLKKLTELGFGSLPVCMAKNQYSFSDDPKRLGRPRDFEMTVREVYVSAGAGFIVALTGDVVTMPGLSKKPSAFGIDVNEDGVITGLF